MLLETVWTISTEASASSITTAPSSATARVMLARTLRSATSSEARISCCSSSATLALAISWSAKLLFTRSCAAISFIELTEAMAAARSSAALNISRAAFCDPAMASLIASGCSLPPQRLAASSKTSRSLEISLRMRSRLAGSDS